MRSSPALTIATVLLACSCVAGKAGNPILSPSGEPSPSASAQPTSTPVPSPSRPNVLLIVADDQRWDTLSVMPKTRRWIADAGASFPHAMVATPLCCPSRSSIFIGDYAHNTGVHDNGDTAWQVIPRRTRSRTSCRARAIRRASSGSTSTPGRSRTGRRSSIDGPSSPPGKRAVAGTSGPSGTSTARSCTPPPIRLTSPGTRGSGS